MTRRSTDSPTLKQVAETAGVSIGAASKVLSGGESSVRVSAKTAEVIREAAKKLRYVPNGHARSLRRRRSESVGLVFENIGHFADGSLFNAMMLDGVSRVVFQNKYRLTILAEIRKGSPVSDLGDGRVDGLVWCKLPNEPGVIEEVGRLNIPCVALCSPPPQELHSVKFFSCDNVGGAEMVVDAMVRYGHKRILFVLERGELSTPDAQARLTGFLTACSRRGICVEADDVVTWSYECDQFAEWFASEPPHTAIFAWNDGVAGNILRQAAALGVAVPNRLSVVGFDSTHYCESTIPRLTAVRQPISEMAKAASEHLFRLMQGEDVSHADVVFPCTLDERESLSFAPSLCAPTSS